MNDVKPSPRRAAFAWEIAGLCALAALTLSRIAISWRKWPDPLIDFGRELYLPWRLAHGAVLYRDVDDFYGPLSQYFNAGLFRAFGPGLMVLVTANLAIFAGIAALLYVLFRRAWGVVGAMVGVGVFIAVFGFAQYVRGGCYTYAAPYAHEATHGLLVCLILAFVLARWVDRPTPWRCAAAGLLFGLVLVLKAEFILAAAALVAAAAWRCGRRCPLRSAAAFAAGAVLPTLGFLLYFAAVMPWTAAWSGATRAWSAVIGSGRYAMDPVQLGFLGFDQPWLHLRAQALATAEALGVGAALLGAAWSLGRIPAGIVRAMAVAALAAAAAGLGAFGIHWPFTGQCLPGVALVYLLWRCRAADGNFTRTLLGLLAAALLARMVLNGRIYQFGFCQAALAAMLAPAALIGEAAPWLRRARAPAAALPLAAAALLAPGVLQLAARSDAAWRLRTHPVGTGRDRFLTVDPRVDPTGELVRLVSERLQRTPPTDTVTVLPEGEMINYLARRASPVAPFFFFSAVTAGGGEAAVVRQLDAHPPDWVVIISRDLREYGIQRYGEAPGRGQEIMDWVNAHYRFRGAAGGDPLDIHQRGAVLLQHVP